MVCNLSIGLFLLFFSPVLFAKSEIMYEGYLKIKSGETQIGYTVQRFEFDAKKKQFKSIYYIQTSKEAGGINESLVAVADDKFSPVSYQYTAKVGDSIKMIDAQFSKNVMSATIGNGKISKKIQKKIPEGTFLSTFLGYLMLQKGYEVGKKFSYQALAEEDAEIYKGEALIKESIQFQGHQAFRILNEYKNAQFISYVGEKGEIFGTSSPVQKLSTELVKQPAEATKGLMMPAKTLKLLFGGVPRGQVNPLAEKKTDTSMSKKASSKTSKARTSDSPTKKSTSNSSPAEKENNP